MTIRLSHSTTPGLRARASTHDALDAAGAASARPTGRNATIDVLRGLSIVLVVLHHTGLRIPLKGGWLASVVPARLLGALTSNGYEAVFVFFVVSGYLIASNALTRWGGLDRIDVRAFYRRRAGRILPCLALLVALLVLLDRIGVDHFVIDRARQTSWRAVVAVAGLHLNWYEGVTGYLPASWDVLWSLSIEEVFYLAFPIVCVLGGRRCWLTPLLLVMALSLPWSHAALDGNEIWQEKAYLPGMAAIATGVLAALVARRWLPSPTTVVLLRVLGLVGLVAVFGYEGFLWRSLHDGTLLVLTVCTAALIISSLRSGAGLRGTRWLQSFGRLSYEVYLGHMFAVWLVVDFQRKLDGGFAHAFAWHVMALASSWLLGWAVARWISRPARRWIMAAHEPRAPVPVRG